MVKATTVRETRRENRGVRRETPKENCGMLRKKTHRSKTCLIQAGWQEMAMSLCDRIESDTTKE
jgi:hypothetical protein